MSDGAFLAWAKILRSVTDSKLVLKNNALQYSEVRLSVENRFTDLGIHTSRLNLRPPTDHVSHLKAYADIDIALDPFPWTGCVTTCESLWMGVPVLTVPGEAFCHRHSASFLTTLGLEDWIAEDVDDYVAKAIEYSKRRDDLVILRQTLRDRMKNSPLCDAPRFARDFENILFQMWQRSI